MINFFHVETLRNDGVWHTFTTEVLEGQDAADRHLASIKEFALTHKQDPEKVRLHRLTEAEYKNHLIVKHPAVMRTLLERFSLVEIEVAIAAARSPKEKLAALGVKWGVDF